MPGSEKIDSMMIAPPISTGSSSAKIVMIGISALRNVCRKITNRSGSPLARAVRTKSCPSASSIETRV